MKLCFSVYVLYSICKRDRSGKIRKMTRIIVETKRFVSECWANVFSEVRGTVVYLDRSAAECLHWCTGGKGYLALKDAGAVAVHELGMYHFRVRKRESRRVIKVG